MVLLVVGLTEKWNHKSKLGYTDKETVKLDFDNTPYKTVEYWYMRVLNWFKLEGYIILKSSTNCYHVVFNRPVSWTENMHIIAWVSLESNIEKLVRYLQMQCIKESSTLRISSKKGKPSPRIIKRFGKQDKEIRNFLKYRRRTKRIIKKLEQIHRNKSH
jgi:hypothetical protein